MQNSEYYLKYLKYKQKYLNLKQFGGEPDANINMNIYLKFITENLVDLLDSESATEITATQIPGTKKRRSQVSVKMAEAEARPKRIIKKSSLLVDYIEDLTPQILRYVSPGSKSRLSAEIEIDDKIIKELNQIEEKEDKEYYEYENNFGKLIEAWVADNMKCPCCGAYNSLRRYLSDFMPIIDLVCINPAHTFAHGVKFFQVKTSNGSLFNEKPYFNYDPLMHPSNLNANTIHVGSRRWGETVHKITPYNNSIEKKILCGYICLEYSESDSNITINPAKSFIVLPGYLLLSRPIRRKLQFDTRERPQDTMSWYYRYLEETKGHSKIEFNLNTNIILSNITLTRLFPSLNFNTSYKINMNPILNPLSTVPD
jgi:hypothetical protein